MTEQIFQTKRGIYGRVNVTLPLTIKTTMLAWQKKSGMKKAEFLRLALTTGFLELSKGIIPANVDKASGAAQADQPGADPCGVAGGCALRS